MLHVIYHVFDWLSMDQVEARTRPSTRQAYRSLRWCAPADMQYHVCKSLVGHRKLGYLTGVFCLSKTTFITVGQNTPLVQSGISQFCSAGAVCTTLGQAECCGPWTSQFDASVSPVALRAQAVCDVPWHTDMVGGCGGGCQLYVDGAHMSQ